jgi:hypothetical protein
VPRYGDTREWLAGSLTLEPPQNRALLYPYAIAALGGLRDELAPPDPELRLRQGRAPLQLAQLAICAAALAYFVGAVFDWRAGRRWRVARAAIPLILVADPVVVHYGLAIMADSLALSGSLVFCAALAALGRAGGRVWPALALLAAAQALTAGMRLEKSAVMLLTAVVSVGAWWLLVRRGAAPRILLRRAPLVLAVVAVTAVGVGLVDRALRDAAAGPSVRVLVLNQRVVYPHLADVYESLPPRVRRRVSLDDARIYDRNIRKSRKVMERASGGDPGLYEALSVDMARTALAQRGAWLAADVAKDALENVLATPSFYGRVAAEQLLGIFGRSNRMRPIPS